LAVAKNDRQTYSLRTFGFGNRNTSGRGVRLPFDNARYLEANEGAIPDFGSVEAALAGFKSRHPYLLFDKRATNRIRKRANKNAKLLARLEISLRASGSPLDQLDLRSSIKRQTRRLIHTSFLALISDGPAKEQALDATRGALLALCSEKSWKVRPVIKSFLDCAEIAVAVSLAYDWLYDEFSGEERLIIEESLFRHLLQPALVAYHDQFMLWPKRRDNCTLVSNSGILVASLAVLARYPAHSAELIWRSVLSSSRIFEALAPDGAWPEGPSYWSLAMRYAALMVAALESSLGQSFGLASRPGFAQTGDFALHAVGPFGAAFNFADSEERLDTSALAWFAHRFQRAADAQLVDSYEGWYLPFMAIWPKRPKGYRNAAEPPTAKVFHSGNLFRNTWSKDPAARPIYLAIKGRNACGDDVMLSPRPEDVILHAQADAGSFIIDGTRQRWVIDLGPDDYDLPGYFDHGGDGKSGPYWQYYRNRTAGHNTLVIDGCDQIPNARVPIVGSCTEGQCKWAVFDLSAAYGKPPGSIRRGAALIGRQVLIQDEIGPELSGTIVWSVHTVAEPLWVSGSDALFRLGDDRCVVRILETETACFELGFPPEPRSFPIADIRQLHSHTTPARNVTLISELPRRVDDNHKRAAGALIRRLQIVWPSGARRLSVLFLPDYDRDELTLPVTPLDEWLARRPVRLTHYPRPELWTDRGFAAEEAAVLGTLSLSTEIGARAAIS
jgi:Heparinase II/III-like protein